MILDGLKALRKAARSLFGEAAFGRGCQVHKTRNIHKDLSDRDRVWTQSVLRRAYQATGVKTAQRLLLDLGHRLEVQYPSAAEERSRRALRDAHRALT